jgi:protein-arginine kinase activator protein McsA
VRFSGLSHAVSLPVNTLSLEMLDQALKKAVEDENYELASQLRDERKRREQK